MNPLREPLPVTEHYVYMNIANHSPPSIPIKNAVREFLDDWDHLRRQGDRRVEEACASFAKLVNAKPDDVACQPNTSQGLATAASSINFQRGDNVIVNDLENWANVYPWTGLRRKGVELRVARGRGGVIHYDDIADLTDDKTKVISISHVQWLTGARESLRPLAELVHDQGGYLVVDGIQAAGALKVDVKRDEVDFYACGSYKWLLGPSGAGFLYVHPDIIDSVKPAIIGYRAVVEHSLAEAELKTTAKKMEFGEPSYLSFVGTKAGIDLILKLGKETIEKHVLTLSQRMHNGLRDLSVSLFSPEEAESRSGIVSFSTGKDESVFKGLTDKSFVVSLRPAGIRVSTGFYNTEEEVDNFLDELEELIKS
jgi:cysteine desulfurase/selenocysteine lyase